MRISQTTACSLGGLTDLQVIVKVAVFVSAHLGGLLQVLDVEQSVVDPEDDPVKQSAVQGLGHGVSHRTSLQVDTHTQYLFSVTPTGNTSVYNV